MKKAIVATSLILGSSILSYAPGASAEGYQNFCLSVEELGSCSSANELYIEIGTENVDSLKADFFLCPEAIIKAKGVVLDHNVDGSVTLTSNKKWIHQDSRIFALNIFPNAIGNMNGKDYNAVLKYSLDNGLTSTELNLQCGDYKNGKIIKLRN